MEASNDTLTKVLGFEPNKELRLRILKEVKDTKQSIEVVARKHAMPELYIIEDGMIDTPDGLMAPEEYEAKHPYAVFTTIQ